MARKRLIQQAAGAAALGAVVLGVAGFSAAHQAPQVRPATLPHVSAHVLNYPNIGTQFPQTFDPADVQDSQSIMVLYMLYDNMVKLNTQNQVVPDLATNWTISSDRKVYTFHLRTDSKFSDGKPITADDVVYSIDRALNPKALNGKAPSPVAATYLGHIVGAANYKGTGDVAGLKRIDAHTVQITLDSPVSFFLQTLTYPTADVVEKGTPLGGLTTVNPMKNQVSSGAFVISKYSENSSLTFKPNPYYYSAKGIKLTEVDMPFIQDVQTAYQAYEGTQTEMTSVPSSRLSQARSMPDFHTSPLLSIDYITYNFNKAPFNDKNMRLAMSYAINRDLINKLVLRGAQTTIYSIVPQGIPGFDAAGQGKVPYFNLPLAKQYLAKAKADLGAKFPSSITIRYQNTSADISNEYTTLQSEWRALGVNVKVDGIRFNDWLGLVAKPTTSLSYTGGDPWVENLWLDDFPDAEDFTSNLLAPTSNYNIGNYNNPQFESLITKALTAQGSERTQLYVQASRIALNDAAWSMIGQQNNNWRINPSVKGLVIWSGTLNPEPVDFDWTKVDVG